MDRSLSQGVEKDFRSKTEFKPSSPDLEQFDYCLLNSDIATVSAVLLLGKHGAVDSADTAWGGPGDSLVLCRNLGSWLGSAWPLSHFPSCPSEEQPQLLLVTLREL